MAVADEPATPTTWRGRVRKRVVASKTYAAVLRRLTPDLLSVRSSTAPEAQIRVRNLEFDADVLVYFADDYTKVYQVEQWLPVLEELNERHRVLILTRNLGTFRVVQGATSLGLVYARRLRDVNDVYQRSDFKVCLYVNNSLQNFQSLSWPRALHLHLNHGESDKVSAASNQAKAYDYVFVAGQAAVDRYCDNLVKFDATKLVRVGRPQLDLDYATGLAKSDRTTVLYAPTWEGDTEVMNYTSLPVFGSELVARLVANDMRVVYKPHPKLRTGTAPAVTAHARVLATLNAANETLPAADRHVVELDAPIQSLFPACDVMISDVSSVVLDWLYLYTDRPVWTTNPRGDAEALRHASPVSATTDLISRGDVPTIADLVREGIQNDARRAERAKMRGYYFDDIERGMSTKRFLDSVTEKISERDRLVSAVERTRTLEIGAAAD